MYLIRIWDKILQCLHFLINPTPPPLPNKPNTSKPENNVVLRIKKKKRTQVENFKSHNNFGRRFSNYKSQPFQTYYELLQLCFSLKNFDHTLASLPPLPPMLQDPPKFIIPQHIKL